MTQASYARHRTCAISSWNCSMSGTLMFRDYKPSYARLVVDRRQTLTDGKVGSPRWMRRHEALTAISAERDRQDSLWPLQAPGGTQADLDSAPDDTMPRLMAALGAAAKTSNDRGESNILTVLIEEVGEVAEAVIEGDDAYLPKELVQVGAVCVKWLEALAAEEQQTVKDHD